MQSKQTGWSLLSTCLVIAIAAVVSIISIKGYSAYKRASQVREVEFDLRQIWQAGMEYYTAVGCTYDPKEKEGSYFASDTEPSWDHVSEVIGEKLEFSGGRDPWVSNYQLKVVRQIETTESGSENAHYHLVIEAELKNLSKSEFDFLGEKLHATDVGNGAMCLSWDRLAFVLRGSDQQAYQPLQANNIGDTQVLEQGEVPQPSRQYCH